MYIPTARKIAAGIALAAGLCVAATPGCSTPALAFTAGDTIPVRVICKSQETVAKHARLVMEDVTFASANATLKGDIERGECMATPVPLPAIVLQSVRAGTFVDGDGDNTIDLVEIDVGAGTNVWSIVIRVVGRGV